MHEHDTVISSITCKCGKENVDICIICYTGIHDCDN